MSPFASLTMNKDLGLTAEMYGFAAGIFFIGYVLFEVPSNLIMHRVGARLWMFRIMLTWGLVSTAMALIYSPTSFYVLRFLLGLAEAGFVPGMFLYLSYWIPERHLGRATGLFILAAPVTTVIAGPLSAVLLELDGIWGIAGLAVDVHHRRASRCRFPPSRRCGRFPTGRNGPSWLSQPEKDWLVRKLGDESRTAGAGTGGNSLWHGLASPIVMLLSAIYVTMVIGLYGIAFWLPQIVRGIGFTNLQTGFVVAVPYALGSLACFLWSRRSDRHMERRWHFAVACFVAAGGLVASAILGPQLLALLPISVAVIGIYAALPVFWCVPGPLLDGGGGRGGNGRGQLRRQSGRLRGAVSRRLAADGDRQLHLGAGLPCGWPARGPGCSPCACLCQPCRRRTRLDRRPDRCRRRPVRAPALPSDAARRASCRGLPQASRPRRQRWRPIA